jgi:hypothetical protein
MAFITMIPSERAEGELLEVYRAMAARPMPAPYRAPHGGAPGIIRAHSLDPTLMRLTFSISGTLNAAGVLTWPQRELINTVTSSVNQCFY